jgi:hypothetical protein
MKIKEEEKVRKLGKDLLVLIKIEKLRDIFFLNF